MRSIISTFLSLFCKIIEKTGKNIKKKLKFIDI